MLSSLFKIFSFFAVLSSAQNLRCYDFANLPLSERPLTEKTCDPASLCQYQESLQNPGGYVQSCSYQQYCSSTANEVNLWRNVRCCNTDFCNTAPGQPPFENSTAPPSSSPSSFGPSALFFSLFIVFCTLLASGSS